MSVNCCHQVTDRLLITLNTNFNFACLFAADANPIIGLLP